MRRRQKGWQIKGADFSESRAGPTAINHERWANSREGLETLVVGVSEMQNTYKALATNKFPLPCEDGPLQVGERRMRKQNSAMSIARKKKNPRCKSLAAATKHEA